MAYKLAEFRKQLGVNKHTRSFARVTRLRKTSEWLWTQLRTPILRENLRVGVDFESYYLDLRKKVRQYEEAVQEMENIRYRTGAINYEILSTSGESR